MTAIDLLALNVGNTRIQSGLFTGGTLERIEHHVVDDVESTARGIASAWTAIEDADRRAIVMASVNDQAAPLLQRTLEQRLGVEVYRIGDDLPVPIGQQLDPETITGVDRLLNAAAAWDTLKQACILIDAGTAVTVDFVDGAGTFQGGAIAPGARLQLAALHDHTAELPALEFAAPDHDEPYGKNTREAMLQGVYHGIRGLVWRLVERYSTSYGAFPTVVATGGDAELLFADDELVNRIVPDLTLRGIVAAARVGLSEEADA